MTTETTTTEPTLHQQNAIGYTIDVITSMRLEPLAHQPGGIGALIAEVHSSISALYAPATEKPVADKPTPAVQISKSITPDFIVCLEDGKKFKSLKRHLRTQYNLTPEQYRERWGLKADYPMVAPNYSATRSQLAKDSGLGRKD